MQIILRFLYTILFLGINLNISAQNNAWIDMFSYLKVKHLQTTDTKIYAQSDNAFFIYDLNGGDIKKLSSINGLSGDDISNFYYHQNLKKLFVFHTGGLIEIVDEQFKVFKSPELYYNSFIPTEKKVLNDIFPYNNELFLATKYGVSIYNLERNEYGDTYYFNNGTDYAQVYSVAIFEQNIYVATNAGLYQADVNANLIDQSVWTKISLDIWTKLAVFNQTLIGVKGQEILQIDNQNFQTLINFNEPVKSLNINEFLNVRLAHQINVYDTGFVLQQSIQDNILPNEQFYDVIDTHNYIYIGTKKHGILKFALGQTAYESIHPDSPLSNHAYAVDARNGILWLAYGDLAGFNPYPIYKEGLSSYQNNGWINIPYDDFQISDVCYVKINPTNTNEVYFGSPKNGLIRVKDNQIDQIFNQTNSPLQMFANDGVRVFGIDFDSENNLWVSQRARPSLLKHKPDDTWETVSLASVLANDNDYHGFSDLKVDENNNVWLGTEYFGVIGYKPSTNQIINHKDGLQTSAYPLVKTIAFDQNNIMWVGNNEGLRILSNPDNLFDNPNIEFKPIKIVYEDAVQLLMEGQDITKIKVDGANNKWIATLGSGVYYFSQDGTKTIYHFTKENSPLPSNDIYDVAIDGSNGKVYFATLQGLVGYKGFATDGGDDLSDVYAFPNPANEKEHEFVTIRGLMKDVNVKIVDVEGNLVYETTSKGGSIKWDLTAFGKYKVASGVYIALITNDDGSLTQTTKILVIK
ncbi:MAG TPA: T9SS type A sorting domain-containing protein [Flavobacteriales bacterium]|nr:T9SS type A sorting domain-containing protein [Flavobacteriales bacterium]